MKKLFILVAIIQASASTIGAQEAFKHLGMGLEVGTTGAGVEVSFPLVTDHLVIKGGYNFPSFSINKSFDVSTKTLNDNIQEANTKLQNKGVPSAELIKTTFNNPEPLSCSAKAKLGAAKLMLEYYPSKKSSFHITAGIYIGSGDFVTIAGRSTEAFMTSYNSLCTEVNTLKGKYGQTIKELEDIHPEDALKYNIGEKTYQLTQKDGKACIDATFNVAKVRPYLGIGFGRSIPGTRCGFQVDLGAWYHGKPALNVPGQVKYDSAAPSFMDQKTLDIIGKIVVYPQLTFRFTCRLF